MIKPIHTKSSHIEIDLTGPNGNVFTLISLATDLAKLLNKRKDNDYFDIKEIQEEMMSEDYEHAIEVMESNFGHMIIMYR